MVSKLKKCDDLWMNVLVGVAIGLSEVDFIVIRDMLLYFLMAVIPSQGLVWSCSIICHINGYMA